MGVHVRPVVVFIELGKGSGTTIGRVMRPVVVFCVGSHPRYLHTSTTGEISSTTGLDRGPARRTIGCVIDQWSCFTTTGRYWAG